MSGRFMIRQSRRVLPQVMLVIAALAIGTAHAAFAGDVQLRNGDHITGKILSLAGGELTVKSSVAGELTIAVKNIKTFSSDELLRIRIGDQRPFESRIVAGPEGKIEVRRSASAPTEVVALGDIAEINPLVPAWEGDLMLNGKLTWGDSRTTEAGFSFGLDKKWEHEQLRFLGEYMYGRERDDETGLMSTSDDFGNAYGKYTREVHDKFYLDGNAKILHDALAELRYRMSPGVGGGYRWFDSYELTLFTDVGIAYTDERFTTFGGRSFWGPQLEYGVEWTPVKRVKVSNTLEWYPSFSDFSGNYVLDAQAGIRFTFWRHTFLECRGEYHYDSEPAPSAKRADYRLIVGPGWTF